MNNQFTHINQDGKANMVDVTDKNVTERQAIAEAYVEMAATTLDLIISGAHHKGDVFATARIAGIMAAKRTADLIPLCHPLALTKVEVTLTIYDMCKAVQKDIVITQVKLLEKTGGKSGHFVVEEYK